MYRVINLIISVIIVGCGDSGNDSMQENKFPLDDFSVSMTLANLPETIVYNHPSISDGQVEYKWSVTFDINGDGVINMGDISIELKHYKLPGSNQVTGNISDFPSSLWLYTTDTQITKQISVNKTILGNTIRMSVEKSLFNQLNSIDGSTLVYFETTKYDPVSDISDHDYYPGFSTLTSIPSNRKFTDILGDVSSVVGESESPIIDMQEMSIEF